MAQRRSVWIGFDPREAACFAVCRSSVQRRLNAPVPVHGISLDDVRERGLYWRPTSRREGRLWDDISRAPMSTEFAISRFLTPLLAENGLALFMDCDILARVNVSEIFDQADPEKAVQVVKHVYEPEEGVKMDGQLQTRYDRKNWSSVVLYNVDHPSNQRLTAGVVNSFPGLNLHHFCWLKDEEIGELPPRYNYLVNHTRLDEGEEPALVHWTEGAPCMPGYENAEYATEFWRELQLWTR